MNHCWGVRVAAIAVLWSGAGAAFAQTLTTWVTNTNAFGPGSLLAAVQGLQPAHAGLQEIRFSLPAGDQVIWLNQPMPDLVGVQVRIDGSDHNSGRVIVDGNGHGQVSVAAGSNLQSLHLVGLTLRRGGRIDAGGCIRVRNANTALTLDAMRVEDCRVYYQSAAPGVRGGALFAAGPLTIRDSLFSGNRIQSDAGLPVAANDALGGAIYKEGAHAVLIERSSFENNRVYLNNTLPSFCSSGHGGAMALNIPGSGFAITIRDSRFEANALSCRNPTVSYDLDGTGDGGAIVYYGNGANHLLLENNYFHGNRGNRGGAVGVIQALTTNVVARNNTFYANQANATGGGLAFVNCCTVTVDHNTFHDNVSGSPGLADQLALMVGTLSSLRHNILNGGENACTASLAASENGIAAYNLYFGGSCLIANDVGSQHVAYMDWLRPPAITGGYVPTLYPAYGSPAIDGGDPNGCASHDARGVVRPVDGNGDGIARCDIGAVESTLVDAIFRNQFE